MANEVIKKNAKIIRENLKDDGTFPNNADLPMLIYQGALDVSKDDLEATVETLVEDKRSRLILVKPNLDVDPNNTKDLTNKILITIFSMMAGHPG